MRDLNKIKRKFSMYDGVDGRSASLDGVVDMSKLGTVFEGFLDAYEKDPTDFQDMQDLADLIVDKMGYCNKQTIELFLSDYLPDDDSLELFIEQRGARKDITSVLVGRFISTLIRKNIKPDETLNLDTQPLSASGIDLDYLAFGTKGITYNVKGDLGYRFGQASEDCIFNVESEVIGEKAFGGVERCKVTVKANSIQQKFAQGAEDSEFNVTADAFGDEAGLNAQRSLFNINSTYIDDKLGIWARECTFNVASNAVAQQLGKDARDCEFYIKAGVGYEAGLDSRRCFYDIEGNTSSCLGRKSENSVYWLKGNTEDIAGQHAIECEFEIEGKAGSALGDMSHKCRFLLSKEAWSVAKRMHETTVCYKKGKIGLWPGRFLRWLLK